MIILVGGLVVYERFTQTNGMTDALGICSTTDAITPVDCNAWCTSMGFTSGICKTQTKDTCNSSIPGEWYVLMSGYCKCS